MFEAKTLVSRANDLKAARSHWENEWREIAEYIRPERGDVAQRTGGGRTSPKLFDSTAIQALKNFSGGLYSALTNPASEWFRIGGGEPGLSKFTGVAEWEDYVSKLLLRSFSPTYSPFYSQTSENYMDIGAWGTGVFFTDVVPEERRFRDAALSIAECFIEVDGWGNVAALHRRFTVKAGYIEDFFKGKKLPAKLKERGQKRPQDDVELQHSTYRNEDFRPGKFGVDGMAWASEYVWVEGDEKISTSGYLEFPYFVPRWSPPDHTGYSAGPGHVVLADTKGLNAIENSMLRAAQWAAEPPVLAPDESAIEVLRLKPRGVSYGAVTRQGQPLVHALQNTGNLFAGEQKAAQKREAIKDGFFWSLMQLVQRTGMTATEILAREEEKMKLMGPHLGRLQSEFLSPLIIRRFNILQRAGQIPPPPPELRGRPLQIEYVSPMARAQQMAEAGGIQRLIDDVTRIAGVDPSAADNLNADEAIRSLREAYGAPGSVIFDRRAVAERRRARAAQENTAMALEAGEKAAKITKDIRPPAGQQQT